ncbi:hypothetical protein GCM10009846_26770 [Agrococcus versicolor]|uniref:Uncharacterized protein n=1 Tax=Agrococcus versicolor TaxID=501482 RepID=A0ABN3AXR4_9MICO
MLSNNPQIAGRRREQAMRRIHSDIRPGRDEEIHRARRLADAVEQRHAQLRQTAIATHGLLR